MCFCFLRNWIWIVGGLFSLKWGVVKIKIVKCFLIMLMMLYSWPSHLLTTVVVFLLMLNFDKVQPIYFVCCEIGQFLSIFWLRKNKIKGEGREVTNFVRTLTKWMAGAEIWLANCTIKSCLLEKALIINNLAYSFESNEVSSQGFEQLSLRGLDQPNTCSIFPL